jgi:hypothetical protein
MQVALTQRTLVMLVLSAGCHKKSNIGWSSEVESFVFAFAFTVMDTVTDDGSDQWVPQTKTRTRSVSVLVTGGVSAVNRTATVNIFSKC